jgi:hypothetical protein
MRVLLAAATAGAACCAATLAGQTPIHLLSASKPALTAPSSTLNHPRAGSSYAGALVYNFSGSQLAKWNVTSNYCQYQPPGFVGDGKVGVSKSGAAVLTTTGKASSCAALISPQAVGSGVIEASVYFSAVPGKPKTIANWTGVWMTDGATWPKDGELDATESEPVNGVNAVSWHSGTESNLYVASTDDYFPAKLPKEAPNLTPGWHMVDIVYTKGFFAVYYDGKNYTTFRNSHVTGSPLNLYLTTAVTPNTAAVREAIGGPPVNSVSKPAAFKVKYVRVWKFK